MKHNRKKKIILSAVFTLVFSAAVSLGNVKDVSAGTDTLTLKAGFYGGPYYEVEVYDDAEMRSLADNNVWTYSGCDTGNFMRVCYAWGVPLETLIADAGIDLNSVKYLHFGTTDSYQEIYATFSASTLLADRYFYPDFVKAATTEDPLQITLDYSKVDSTIAGNRYKVPTILAIGSTGFSREEAASVLSRQAYLSPTQSELPETFKFRLLYGQLGITSGAAAYNVQTSDKWVYEINVQLAGSPNLVVNRELISGNAGEVGSKYKLTVTAELPSSYNYLSSSIRSALSQQVLQSVQNSYDSSKVKITDLGNGTYEMEVLSEGEINVDFSYSRTDYGGDVVTAWINSSQVSGDGTQLSICVNGEEKASYSLEELMQMENVDAYVELTSGKAADEKGTYTGVKLTDLLEQAGIEEYETVIFVAGDGYSSAADEDEVDTIIIAHAKDGETLGYYTKGGTGPLRCIFTEDTYGNRSIQYLTRIECR